MSSGLGHIAPTVERIGRYTLVAELAAGGMGTVHLARFNGEAGFSRTVVVKRLHPQFAKDPDFVCGFLDEARLASRVRHPNVVSVYDVVGHRGELLLAMDYVHGVSLHTLVRATKGAPIAISIALALVRDLLAGLHAAHETHDRNGESMQIVHRDVSPQNLMVGDDGVARVVDFGIASATARLQTTGEGQIKGKLSYMAPEQIRSLKIDRRVDVFAAGIVLWQLLTGAQFAAGVAEQRINFILGGRYRKPSELNSAVSPQLDEIVMKALSANPATRFATAEEFSRALAQVAAPAAAFEVAGWVRSLVGPFLKERALLVRAAENASVPPPSDQSSPNVARASSDGTETEVSETRRVPVVLVPVSTSHTDTAVTKTASEPTGGARRIGAAGGLVVVMVAAAAGLWFVWSGNASTSASGARDATKIAALEAPRATAAAPAFNESGALANPPKDAVPPPEPAPAASTKPVPATSATAATTRKRQVRPATRPVASSVASAPKVKDPCSPPYVLLEGGIRKYKPECL